MKSLAATADLNKEIAMKIYHVVSVYRDALVDGTHNSDQHKFAVGDGVSAFATDWRYSITREESSGVGYAAPSAKRIPAGSVSDTTVLVPYSPR